MLKYLFHTQNPISRNIFFNHPLFSVDVLNAYPTTEITHRWEISPRLGNTDIHSSAYNVIYKKRESRYRNAFRNFTLHVSSLQSTVCCNRFCTNAFEKGINPSICNSRFVLTIRVDRAL